MKNALRSAAVPVVAAGLLLSLPAAVVPGENMLNNPTLAFGGEGGPDDWNLSFEKVHAGADFKVENGMNLISFKPRKGETTIAQAGITLKEGAKVKVGAWVRTSGYASAGGGVIIYNYAWTKSDGPGPFPRDTGGKWVRFEKEVTVPASYNGRYSFAIYTLDMKEGSAEVRDPYLFAVDAESAAAARPAVSFCRLGVVTPVSPLLSKILEGDSKVSFSFISREKKARCSVSTRMEGEERWRSHGGFPLENDRVVARLSGMEKGKGEIKAEMYDAGGKLLASSVYPIRVNALPAPLKPGRRLNNLVTSLVSAEAADAVHAFDMPSDGWVWISFSRGNPSLKAFLDGVEVVRHRDGEGYETLRRLKAGSHSLSVSGSSGGTLTVNKVPATSTYSYPLPIKQLSSYKEYSGDFLRKRMFPHFGIFSCGYNWKTMPAAELKDFLERGKEYYSQSCRINGRVDCGIKLAERLADSHLAGTPIVGRTFDEIPISSISDKLEYSRAMRLLAQSSTPMATWSSGYTFTYNALNAEYLSACVNQGQGRGVFQFECYPYIQPDEAAAKKYLDEMLNDSIRRAKRLVPDVLANSWVVMGTYTRLDHALNYDDCPAADYKRLVDMYLHRLATDPEFDGLAGFGVYCYHNAEEEDLRWILDLMRHYLLEGKTAMPSDRLGYAYNPGHLENGNFAAGLGDWKVKPAEEGSISVRKFKELPRLLRYRHHSPGSDSACVFRRSALKANAIGKELVNLVPGKVYCLRYAVASVKEMSDKGTEAVARDFGVTAKLSGVEDLTASSPLERICRSRRDIPKLNVRFIVFRALGKTARLGIFDTPAGGDGEAGEELAVTALRVKPYYGEKTSIENR